MRAIIAAAGTGGHINPGISIANKIKQMQPSSEVIFIGTRKRPRQRFGSKSRI